MNPYLALTATILLAGLLLALPLVPAVVELQRKTDAQPLSVVLGYAGDIRHFADGFRQYVAVIEPVLQRCRESGTSTTGVMQDDTPYLVLGFGSEAVWSPMKEHGSCDFLIATARDLRLPSGISFAKDIFAKGNIVGEEANQYRAIYGEQNIHLAASSVVSRWAHANGEFSIDQGCVLYGRISSNQCIRLAADCIFLRLNAPRIELNCCVDAAVDTASNPIAEVISKENKSSAHERQLLDGDIELPEGQTFHGNLIVRGKLRIRRGARIYGSVKSEKDLTVEDGVAVSGSLMTERKLVIGRQCSIHGPVIAEREILIRSGSRCGSPEFPTTVGAPRISIEEGSLIFGTLWAREAGQVVAK